MTSWENSRLDVNHAARLLKVRTAELKEAIINEKPLPGGVTPPQPLYKTGSGGWVFTAGDVMEVANKMNTRP